MVPFASCGFRNSRETSSWGATGVQRVRGLVAAHAMALNIQIINYFIVRTKSSSKEREFLCISTFEEKGNKNNDLTI